MERQRKLYVPANVTLRSEVMKGLSWTDGVIVLLMGILFCGIGFAAYQAGVELLWVVIGVLFCTGFVGMILMKLPTNLSVLDYILIMMKYSKEQKHFYYVHRR